MLVDAHQHFWRLANSFSTWPTSADVEIYKDFLPTDLAPLLQPRDIHATILVQAAPDIEETEFLLALAEDTDFVRGVVGWIDMESASAHSDLKSLSKNPLFKGIRPMLQGLADPLWILDPHFDVIFRTLIERDLSFDALILPQHLEAIRVLAARYPSLNLIIDHGAKPQIRDGIKSERGFAGWSRDVALFRNLPNVSCKLSGLLTEAEPRTEGIALRPYFDHLYEIFGPKRLMWGSDWPVINLASSYGHWMSLCQAWLSEKSEDDYQNIMGANAQRIYKISPHNNGNG